MTPRQQRFVEEYLVDLNASQAIIRAGYKGARPDEAGRRTMRNREVQNAIDVALAGRSKRTEITADRVVLELARIAFVDPRKVFKWGPHGVTLIDSDSLTEDEAAVIAEVSETTSESGGSIRGKQYDKIKALELLGRHLGMFVDKKEIDLAATVNVFDDETRAQLMARLKED